MEKKLCRDCGTDRAISEFTRNRNSGDGYAFYCRNHARKRHQVSRDQRTGGPRSRHPRGLVVPDGSKWCPDCGTIQPLTDFPRTRAAKSGRYTYCKVCHNARGRATLDAVGGARTYHLKRRYGITAEEADAMLEAQGGVCAVCKRAPAVHVDHDHATGAVRALLCFNCNGGLGQFKDDPNLLHAAAYYVALHTARQQVAAEIEALRSGRDAASRPGEPPVGSQRRPEARGTSARSTGRTSGARRQTQAGEADG